MDINVYISIEVSTYGSETKYNYLVTRHWENMTPDPSPVSNNKDKIPNIVTLGFGIYRSKTGVVKSSTLDRVHLLVSSLISKYMSLQVVPQ